MQVYRSKLLFFIIFTSITTQAFGLGRSRDSFSDDSDSSSNNILRYGTSHSINHSSCMGMKASAQDLTQAGYSLEKIPPAFQGIRRERFGSCSMAGSITALNAYFQSRKMHPQPKRKSRFDLGNVHPWYTASFGRLKGGWDEAVENNFKSCFNERDAYANTTGMGQCLSRLISRQSCLFENSPTSNVNLTLQKISSLDHNLSQPAQCGPTTETKNCSSPKLIRSVDSIESRRKFIRDQFENPDPSQILPITIAWDTGVADGAYNGSLNHISNIIGRRVNRRGKCELLIRNSYSNFCLENKDYPNGECHSPGKTDDFWVDEESLMKHSGDFVTYANP